MKKWQLYSLAAVGVFFLVGTALIFSNGESLAALAFFFFLGVFGVCALSNIRLLKTRYAPIGWLGLASSFIAFAVSLVTLFAPEFDAVFIQNLLPNLLPTLFPAIFAIAIAFGCTAGMLLNAASGQLALWLRRASLIIGWLGTALFCALVSRRIDDFYLNRSLSRLVSFFFLLAIALMVSFLIASKKVPGKEENKI